MKPNLLLLWIIVVLSVITFNSESQNAPSEGVYASVSSSNDNSAQISSPQDVVSKYCNSKAKSIAYGWIEEVKIGASEIASGSNSGYGNHTDKEVVINCGSFNTIDINSGQPFGSEKHNWRIWIDYNQDGEYGNDEQIISDYSVHLNALVYIPQLVKSTTSTGMRVVMNKDDIPNACGIFEYGEVEDYNILLKVAKRKTSLSPASEIEIETGLQRSKVRLFPNPASIGDELKIKIAHHKTEDVQLSVFSIDGRLMWSSDVVVNSGKQTIDIMGDNKKSGVYLLKMRTQENSLIKMFTIVE